MPDAARVAVVIGGGNGIGEATCRLMHERGWQVVVADKDSRAAERVASDTDATCGRFGYRRRRRCRARGLRHRSGKRAVAALVVAAAMFQDVLPPAQLPMDVWERTMQVNLTGTYLANRAFGTRMAAAGGGSIVNIASIAAIASMPVHAYGTSKAAVVALTRNLAGEWGRAGVRVNAVSPGSTLVPRVEERIRSGRYAADPGGFTALGRMVRAERSRRSDRVPGLRAAPPRSRASTWSSTQAGMSRRPWAQYGGVPPAPGGRRQP